MPNEAVAGDDALSDTVAIVDSQVQSICTWTTVVVGVVMGIYSRRIVVNFVPSVTVTGCDIECGISVVVDC